MLMMSRIGDDLNGVLSAGKKVLVPDYQFLKTVQECGRALLNSSKRPAAIAVRKDAAQTLIHTFAERFGITYTENQIFKKFYNMKQRLRSRLSKKEPLNDSEQLLKKLLDEEELANESHMQTVESQPASTFWDSAPEPQFCQLDDDISQYSPPNVRDTNEGVHAVEGKVEKSSHAGLRQKVLQEQLKMLHKQAQVLDAQKEMYLLQKEELLAELNEHKSKGNL